MLEKFIGYLCVVGLCAGGTFAFICAGLHELYEFKDLRQKK